MPISMLSIGAVRVQAVRLGMICPSHRAGARDRATRRGAVASMKRVMSGLRVLARRANHAKRSRHACASARVSLRATRVKMRSAFSRRARRGGPASFRRAGRAMGKTMPILTTSHLPFLSECPRPRAEPDPPAPFAARADHMMSTRSMTNTKSTRRSRDAGADRAAVTGANTGGAEALCGPFSSAAQAVCSPWRSLRPS